jgi:transposase
MDPDVAVFQHHLEPVGIAGFGQQALGLGAILLHILAEARKLLKLGVRHGPRRKTDVLDCQWIQQLHPLGLLAAAFRPAEDICVLRSYYASAGCSSPTRPTISSTCRKRWSR